ncbi:glutamate--cysteine ligase [Embleya sp. NPDC050154]|uniref:glutamate--cysteine ligase n=1 Tax=Embleya sp. NPDC050154 TaxID=3363988 RepID=UPI00379D861D
MPDPRSTHATPAAGATAVTGPAAESTAGNVPTMGVEEEFLLVDAHGPHPAPRAEAVLAEADDGCDTTHIEATRYQVESATPIAHTAQELRTHLLTLRRRLAAAATAHDCRLVASATPVVLASPPASRLVNAPRRHEQRARYGSLTDTLVVCGCHVHIGTLDLETAVGVLGHIRPWLPTLIALGANSPFWEGRDTGHASWRAVSVSCWPASGSPPRLDSAEHYHRTLADLVASGAVMDAKMIYWDARPSAHWPTVEIRAPDVSTSVDEAVLQAVLVRALVTGALRAVHDGRPTPDIRDGVLTLARRRAARDGLEGRAVDPHTADLLPANTVVDALIDHVSSDLDDTGDLPHVERTLATLRRDGCGARRRRRAFERRGLLSDVVDHLAEATIDQDA